MPLHSYISDFVVFFFFKQKTAYEMRISDWSSDVCSSDLGEQRQAVGILRARPARQHDDEIGDMAVHDEGFGAVQPIAAALDRRRGQLDPAHVPAAVVLRSEERRVGKECVSTCRSRWSPYHYNKKKQTNMDK